MKTSANSLEPEAAPAWFCLRSQTKHEHIAAGHLRQIPEVEVFLPRIRFRRKTQRGAVWFTEALFPAYLFARFVWHRDLRRVQHASGVRSVIHFGDRWPTVSEETMADLRQLFGTEELHVIPATPEIGDNVGIAGGVFHGLQAVVTRIMPGCERVKVLLEFLGRQTMVELPLDQVVAEEDGRRRLG